MSIHSLFIEQALANPKYEVRDNVDVDLANLSVKEKSLLLIQLLLSNV